MEIVVQSSKIVKPSYGGGRSWDNQQVAEAVIPLTVFDQLINDNEYISSIHAFHPPSPTSAALEQGLAMALAEYREWAGRLVVDHSTGRRAILLNDAGARFFEATADVALDTIMPQLLPGTPMVQRLHPSSSNGTEELTQVQITRFACGSLVVGHTMLHAVGDGFGICNFLLGWGQATRGVAIDPLPVHDRRSFFVPRDPPMVEFELRGVELVARDESTNQCGSAAGGSDDGLVITRKVQFSREFISDLKSRASAACARRRRPPYSLMQCLVAHLWRCMTKARGLTGCEVTRLHIAVNGRGRMTRPRVPEGYTGNVLLWAHPVSTAQELLTASLGHASELIRREVDRLDDAYFRSFIDFMSSGSVEKEGLVPAEFQDEVCCIHRIPFYDLDFGGGRQFLYVPCYRPVDGLIYILPSAPLGHGSMQVQVSLLSHVMEAFMDCCYSLAAVPPVVLQSKI
jgi:hypothetical protein